MPHMWQISPFGNLMINGYWLLPSAYRNLLRPSSPLNAKASTKYPFALDSYSANIV